MKRFDATIFAAAPGVIRQMLRAPLPALPRLRHGLTAGEALAPALRRQWQEMTGTDLPQLNEGQPRRHNDQHAGEDAEHRGSQGPAPA